MLADDHHSAASTSTHVVKVTQVVPSSVVRHSKSSNSTSVKLRQQHIIQQQNQRRERFMNRPNVQNGLAGSNNSSNNNNSSNRSNYSSGGDGGGSGGDISRRPPFITTVTRGKFLPSKFDLMLERTLYTFSSRPRPVGVSKHHCSLFSTRASHQQNSPPRGVHDYFNLMWDPHIRRGNTGTGTRVPAQREEVAEARSVSQTEGATTATTANGDGSSAAKTRKKRSSYMNRSSRYRIQRVRTPPPGKGRLQALVQTDAYLEYLTDDSCPPETNVMVQTDPIRDQAFSPPPPLIPMKTGVDASTQVLPGELDSFDDDVQPIVATLVAKIMEQSLVEVMEEEELEAIREQQRRFEEKKREEERQLRLLQEQHQRISAERERLRKHLESRQERPGMDEEGMMSVNEESFQLTSSVGGGSGGGPVYTTSDLLELLPSVLDSLRQEGFLSDGAGDDAFAQLSAVINSGSTPSSLLHRNKDNVVKNNNGSRSSGGNPSGEEPFRENGSMSPVELEPEGESWAALESSLDKQLESSEKSNNN